MGKRKHKEIQAVLYSGLPEMNYRKEEFWRPAAAGIILCFCVLFFVHTMQSQTRKVTHSATAGQKETVLIRENSSSLLPAGFSGLLKGLEKKNNSRLVRRIGTRAEKILVGQRIRRTHDSGKPFNLSGFLENQVCTLHDAASSVPPNALFMSDFDYEAMLRIVEAEAGTEDLKGRILVANVIMNRVKDERFPDTAAKVIYSCESGVAQFSPVDDGRLYEVTVTAGTRKAVRMALEGRDESRGALFFIQKDAADPDNILWFDHNLTHLFRHGVHDFYTYPETEAIDSSVDAK